MPSLTPTERPSLLPTVEPTQQSSNLTSKATAAIVPRIHFTQIPALGETKPLEGYLTGTTDLQGTYQLAAFIYVNVRPTFFEFGSERLAPNAFYS